MRHGPAEDQSASGADGDRPLTASGGERVCSVATLLVEAEEEPLHIITSPLVRAVQTAEIVALLTGLGERGGSVEVRREIAPGASAEKLVHQLASEEKRRVMLVGHEPDLSGLVAALVGRFGRSFDKAMVVGVHVPSQGGPPRLRFVLDPKALKVETASP